MKRITPAALLLLCFLAGSATAGGYGHGYGGGYYYSQPYYSYPKYHDVYRYHDVYPLYGYLYFGPSAAAAYEKATQAAARATQATASASAATTTASQASATATAANTQLTAVQTDVKSVLGAVKDLSAVMAQVNARVGNVEGRIKGIEERVATLERSGGPKSPPGSPPGGAPPQAQAAAGSDVLRDGWVLTCAACHQRGNEQLAGKSKLVLLEKDGTRAALGDDQVEETATRLLQKTMPPARDRGGAACPQPSDALRMGMLQDLKNFPKAKKETSSDSNEITARSRGRSRFRPGR